MGMRVKEIGESECCPVMGQIRVEAMPTLLDAKAGRLPIGLSSRESLCNRLRLEGK